MSLVPSIFICRRCSGGTISHMRSHHTHYNALLLFLKLFLFLRSYYIINDDLELLIFLPLLPKY